VWGKYSPQKNFSRCSQSLSTKKFFLVLAATFHRKFFLNAEQVFSTEKFFSVLAIAFYKKVFLGVGVVEIKLPKSDPEGWGCCGAARFSASAYAVLRRGDDCSTLNYRAAWIVKR
jgi:hypothetical protein